MRLLTSTTLFLLMSGAAALAGAKPEPVKAELIADTAHVAPGQVFHLGLYLMLEPEWHVYWINPGDAGLPTKVEFEAPPGFEVKLLPYPAPVQFDQPGNVVGYGYKESLLLMAEVKAPAELKPDTSVEFTAKGKWLVCKQICLPGKASVTLSLKAVAPTQPAVADNAPLFADWMERLPVPAEERAEVAQKGAAQWREVTLKWKNPVQNVRVFTAPGDAYAIKNLKVDAVGGVSTIRYTTEQLDKSVGPVEMTMVIAYDDVSGRQRSVRLIEPIGTSKP